MKGLRPENQQLSFSRDLPDPKPSLTLPSPVVDEIALLGSRCGPMSAALAALAALAARRVDAAPLISRTFSFDEGVQAFDYAVMPGAMKVILRP
jgi:threonine dehydrogenase-like Zn-dependent dehydrogenase